MDRLPLELLWNIFSYAGAQSVLTARRVCESWRSAATAHPYFWSNVSITSTSAPALDYARARLAAAGSRALSLDIRLGKTSRVSIRRLKNILPFRSLQREGTTALAELVKGHLPNLQDLRLSAPAKDLALLTQCLLFPAPLLEFFKLEISIGSVLEYCHPVPSDLFAQYAPRLRSVELSEYLIPLDPIAAFETVEHVRSNCFASNSPCCVFLFRVFPALKSLKLAGGWGVHQHIPPPQDILHSMRQLVTFDLQLQGAYYEHFILHELPPYMDALVSLTVVTPTAYTCPVALAWLPRPWRASFEPGPSPSTFRLRLRSAATINSKELALIINFNRSYWEATFEELCFLLVGGVSQLALHASVWDNLPAPLPRFQLVEDLRLAVDVNKLPKRWRDLPNAFPSLRKLHLCASAGVLDVCVDRSIIAVLEQGGVDVTIDRHILIH